MRPPVVGTAAVSVLIGCATASPTQTQSDPPAGPPAEPEIFAPGVVSTPNNELNLAMAPDGGLIVFSLSDRADEVATLLISERTAAGWSPPRVAPFSGRYSDVDPSFSPDGRVLYFSSKRPLRGDGPPKDADLWAVDRTGRPAKWGNPKHLGSTINTNANDWHVTATRTGVLYFSTWNPEARTDDLYRAVPQDHGGWQVSNVGPPINTGQPELDPFIDPDERFIIFASYRDQGPGSSDLYISFRSETGAWSDPALLPINTPGREYCPAVSPDGTTFFFTRKRPTPPRATPARLEDLLERFETIDNSVGNVYWMRADFIRDLRPSAISDR